MTTARRALAALFCTTLAAVFTPASHAKTIIASPADGSVEYHFDVGLSYASGLEKLMDKMEENFGFEGKGSWPIGIRLGGFAKYPSGFAVGGSVGPATVIEVKERDSGSGYYHSNTQSSYIIPVSFDVRYYFSETGTLRPYARAGISYPFTGGDYLGSGTAGPVVALGAYFYEHRIFALGLEVGYDGAKVEVERGYYHDAQKVAPIGFTAGFLATF